jgi:hypothetical protein
MAANPAAFLRKLFESESLPVNNVIIDEELLAADQKTLGPDGGDLGTRPHPQVWHCTAPPEDKSTFITIVPS